VIGDVALAEKLRSRLRLPVIAAPMFIASTPDLLAAQCKSGIVGSMPALSLRTTDALDAAITEIETALAAHDAAHPETPAAPFAINLIAHASNDRHEADLDVILRHRVPIVIVSLAGSAGIVGKVHAYGGVVLNDVASDRHARKCADIGVDGLIAVCAGAGGHTGSLSPFAFVQELRQWWQGPLALSGSIATGRSILAAQAMGADFAYIGSPFLATDEANTQDAFKAMVIASSARDLVVTNSFTGVNASFLRPSLETNGFDPDRMTRPEGAVISIRNGGANSRAWRDIWSAGQGIGAVREAGPAAAYVDRLTCEYDEAKARFIHGIG